MTAAHPIEQLIATAEKEFRVVLKTQSTSLEEAAAKYRKKRGRHPPPGFDTWYNFAAEKGAIVVEEFWDQIYHDLGPFWGVEPHRFRHRTHAFHPKISIRDGVVSAPSIDGHARLAQWTDMLQSLASYPHVHLPDVDIPVNVNDEPAMLVPWETIDTALSTARRILLRPAEVLNEYSSLRDLDAENSTFTFDPEWLGPRLTHPSNAKEGPRPFWSLVRPACPLHSPAHVSPIFTDIWHPQGHTSDEHSAANMLPIHFPNNTLKGYVSNWTIAIDPCEYPNLQGLHGAFVAPGAMSVTTSLFPLFGASKISISNEILIPSSSDWNTSYSYVSQALALPWGENEEKLCWHYPATGGHNTARNWQRFQRHRFVAMLNATQLEVAEANLHAGNESSIGLAHSGNFRLLPGNEYKLITENGAAMAEWVAGWAQVGFTDLRCDEDESEKGACPYNGAHFSVTTAADSNNIEAEEDQKEKSCKYTAALDGDGGDSSVFLHSLNAGKAVLKASIYKQWYDARLTAWLHFIPMDNTLVDLYGIMEFFLGTRTEAGNEDFAHLKIEGGGHDAKAKKIAQTGKEWAGKVLRREDMLLYVYRLVLEYARVTDDRRVGLGWVGDLIGEERR
ncbi:glycosyltransferase family 90 protein [Melanomma pulvis-pyrius CBS 109.77]|uniref:Glycosyltransferase family 90 protein n=1 Tax=Melanomma pulvis-pyrius CBS 109.77 TaxID=1314802 RepID=A0A6A6XJ78_9PLEO|nr:glycosyltransferase family 90 protein [Melanomma pulvis-pyrius CBS 109.77]